MSFETHVYQKQAEIIDKLNKEIQSLKKENDRLAMKEKAADFYLLLQQSILSNEIVMEEWRRFISIVKLSVPDSNEFEKKFK